MSRIESRKRPPIDVLGQPSTGEALIFRLPLPPASEIVRGVIPHFVCALLAGVVMFVVARLQAAAPTFVTLLLGACVLINAFAAAARYLSPKTPLSEVLRVAGLLAVCGALLCWHDKLWMDGTFDLGLLGVIVAIVFLSLAGQHLVRGRTATDSLLWAGGFIGVFLAARLPYVMSVTTAFYLLFVPLVAANITLAWCIGSGYARYYIADPLLAHVQAAEGEELREKLYDFGPKGPPAVGFSALLTFLCPLAFYYLAPIGFGWLHPDWDPSKIELTMTILCVLGSALGAAAYPVLLPLLPLRQAWPLILEAHLVWLGYDATGPAAGAGTFRFPGILSRAPTRRALYGLLLVANVLTMRLFWTCVDLQVARLTLPQWALYTLTFLLPLGVPFGLSVLVHDTAFFLIRQKTQEGDGRA